VAGADRIKREEELTVRIVKSAVGLLLVIDKVGTKRPIVSTAQMT